jgi:hypothetical protein
MTKVFNFRESYQQKLKLRKSYQQGITFVVQIIRINGIFIENMPKYFTKTEREEYPNKKFSEALKQPHTYYLIKLISVVSNIKGRSRHLREQRFRLYSSRLSACLPVVHY